MDLVNSITWILTVSIATVGWLFERHKSRQQKIFELKVEHRIAMLKTCADALAAYSRQPCDLEDAILKLRNASLSVQLFGSPQEIKLFENFSAASMNNDNDAKVNTYNEFGAVIVANLRKQLNLESIQRRAH